MSVRQLLLLGLVIAAAACPLQRVSGSVGDACHDTSDCDDDALACVSADPDDAAAGDVCMPPPDGWICSGHFYKDIDTMCDCGCGIIDVDCAGNASAAACDENNCESGDPLPTNNADCG
ncbi:MAG: hypothetical protein HYS27_03640 [Deltaproteobacteria bacterium]|nr:hypothetical protein [Deltaproteobacteria bacterium]